jgi:hypothetical protein
LLPFQCNHREDFRDSVPSLATPRYATETFSMETSTSDV